MLTNSSWTLPCVAFVAMFSLHPLVQPQGARRVVDQPLRQKIMDLERQGWEAAKKRDSAAAQSLLTDDALDVGKYGIWDAKKSAESIASLEKHPESTLVDYSVSGWNFRRASESVVVVAYKVTLINRINNVRQSRVVQYYSAVWVRQGDTWRNLLFHNSTAPEKSKGAD
jgi:hypothetical protein